MSKELTAEDIEAAFAAVLTNTRKCSIGNVIEQYPSLESKIMDVEHFGGQTVSKVLRGLGVSTASGATVNKHRKGECCCPKEAQ